MEYEREGGREGEREREREREGGRERESSNVNLNVYPVGKATHSKLTTIDLHSCPS